MVNRSVAIALGIICIILIAGLGGAMAYCVSTHHYTDSDYDSLNSQNTNLNNIVNLANYTTWLDYQTITQPAGSNTSFTFSASYAGYVRIIISSLSPNIFANVVYSAYGVNYNNTIFISLQGVACFPVLPSPNITVEVGNFNPNLMDEATVTVSIIYNY